MTEHDTQDNAAQSGDTAARLSRSPETSAALVAEKCFTDQAFGEKFLANPKAALEEQGIKLGHREVHAHENDAHNWHIVLPNLKAREALSKYTDEEVRAMNDADMKSLSGGELVITVVSFATLFVAAGVGTAGATAGAVIGTHKSKKKK